MSVAADMSEIISDELSNVIEAFHLGQCKKRGWGMGYAYLTFLIKTGAH